MSNLRKWRGKVCTNSDCPTQRCGRVQTKHWHRFDGKIHTFTCATCGQLSYLDQDVEKKRFSSQMAGKEKFLKSFAR